MPRPKSELTDNHIRIGARLTESHREEWKRLGGSQWLRKELAKSLANRRTEQQKR